MYLRNIKSDLRKCLRTLVSITYAVVLIGLLTSTTNAAGELDPSFNASISISGGNVHKTVIQPDGKILVGGTFRSINNVAREGLARLNADGSIDTTFNSPEFYSFYGLGGDVYAIKVLSDGKILVAGTFIGEASATKFKIIKLNSDGSVDNSFNVSNSLFPFASWISDVEVYPDGRILIGGSTNGTNGFLYRLNPNGTQDTTFNPAQRGNVVDITLLPDEKIYVSGGAGFVQSLPPYFVRMNQDGSTDASFSSIAVTGTSMNAFAIQPDGKVLVGGNYTFSQGGPGYLARFNADGSLDSTFNAGGPSGPVYAILPLANGKFVIGGDFINYTGISRVRLALINSDGSLDTSFTSPLGLPTTISIRELNLQGADKILVGGAPFESAPNQQPLFRLNLNGSIDSSFQPLFSKEGVAYRLAIQPDGKILVGGKFTRAGNAQRNALVRFNADGSLDTSFNQILFAVNDEIRAIAVQSDGKILTGNSRATTSSNAVRLNPNGTQDISFANTPGVRDFKILSNGKILIAGNSYLKLFNQNGTLDTAFNVTITGGLVNRILIQPDNKILIVGDFTEVNGFARGRVARLHPDGLIDISLNTSVGANNSVYDVAVQSDGKVLIGGLFDSVNLTSTSPLARLNNDGSLDTTFNPALGCCFSIGVHALKIQPSGKLLVGTRFATDYWSLNQKQGIRRLNPNGSVDTTFNVGTGTNGTVWNIESQPDGKILAAGQFTRYKGSSAIGVMRILDNILPSKTLFDFDGDLKADVSIYRPSTNVWYIIQSSNFQITQQSFGASGDIVAPADYDGDGKTDLGIFRPSTGTWWYKSSTDSIFRATQWGASGDIPLPSDFDGDGKADFIVYRPMNNILYRLGSGGQTSNVPFGVAGDLPLTGDFDGDGKSDPAIFRPSTGDWWWQASSDNAQRAIQWGVSTDKCAPADYDGDGKTDIAVYRPSTGVWYILNSSNGSPTILQFGVAEDKPVAADYDGDGKADIAVFRPSTGIWYILRSTAGFWGVAWGVSTDIPTPNAFVP